MANSLATGTAPNLLGRVTEGIVDVSHSFVGAADVCVRPHVFFVGTAHLPNWERKKCDQYVFWRYC